MSQRPGLPPWSNDLLKLSQQVRDAIQRSAVQFPSPEAIADAYAVFKRYQAVVGPAFQRALDSVQSNQPALEHLQRLWRQHTPDNWHALESAELDLIDMVEESGISVVWAPRAVTIDTLIAEENEERYAILARASDEVLDDLEAVLDRASGADVRGHADACAFAAEAIVAARDGHWNAAQALAASGLGQVVHGMFGYPLLGGLGAAHKRFSQRDVDAATMMILKVALLEVCTVKALTDMNRADPQQFNRHGTQHGDRRFFSQPSALAGLLLLVGWIREFTWIAENRRNVLADDENDDSAFG